MRFEDYWEKYGELHASMCGGNIKQFAKEIWMSAQPECKRNKLSFREVRELLKECEAECCRCSYEPCEKCRLQGSDGRCLRTKLWGAISEDYDIDKAITLYNQIREKLK